MNYHEAHFAFKGLLDSLCLDFFPGDDNVSEILIACFRVDFPGGEGEYIGGGINFTELIV